MRGLRRLAHDPSIPAGQRAAVVDERAVVADSVISTSRQLKAESRQKVHSATRLLARSALRLLVSHELLESLGKPPHAGGRCAGHPAGQPGAVGDQCLQGFSSAHESVSIRVLKHVFRVAVQQDRTDPVVATIDALTWANGRGPLKPDPGGVEVSHPDDVPPQRAAVEEGAPATWPDDFTQRMRPLAEHFSHALIRAAAVKSAAFTG